MTILDDFAHQIAAAHSGSANELYQGVLKSLNSVIIKPDLLPVVTKPADQQNYARYLLYEDPGQRFSIFSLVWNKGQMTPVHGHNYWCAYGVVAGTITENFYAYDAVADKATLTSGMHPRAPGYACFHAAGLETIHQLSNQGEAQAISLHVYGTVGAELRRHAPRDNINFAAAKQINRLVEVA